MTTNNNQVLSDFLDLIVTLKRLKRFSTILTIVAATNFILAFIGLYKSNLILLAIGNIVAVIGLIGILIIRRKLKRIRL